VHQLSVSRGKMSPSGRTESSRGRRNVNSIKCSPPQSDNDVKSRPATGAVTKSLIGHTTQPSVPSVYRTRVCVSKYTLETVCTELTLSIRVHAD